MQKAFSALLICALLMLSANVYARENHDLPQVREGDVIFQALAGGQNYALYLVTGSRYTHCGIIMEKDGVPYVYEAVGPVKLTPLAEWIDQGVNGHYVLMRLKDAATRLTPEVLAAMDASGAEFAGKPYDFWFQWSDDYIYCSELIWKIYQRGADIELAPLRPFSSYDNVDHAEVQRIAKERFNLDIPWDTEAVAPSDLMSSPLLETIMSN